MGRKQTFTVIAPRVSLRLVGLNSGSAAKGAWRSSGRDRRSGPAAGGSPSTTDRGQMLEDPREGL
jgi:hypothetical protein